MPNFSGTTSATPFETRKVIDLAFGRCKLAPQQITAEYLQIGLDLLYAFLSTLSSKGLALWATQKLVLPMYQNTQSVPAPASTVDVLNCNLRNTTWLQGTSYTSVDALGNPDGVAANAFDQNISTACTQSNVGGYIQAYFASPVVPTTFGIMPNATGTWSLSIQTSTDGKTWTTVWSNAAFQAVQGQWQWIDIQGIPLAGINYVQLVAGALTVLNITEFQIQNNPQEIPIAKINRDDYANLPNKSFPGRPTIFWYDKQADQPILTLWPTPAAAYTYQQLVCYVQQYIQDVGSLSQQLWIPQRWFLPVIENLALELATKIPEVDWSDPRVEMLPTSAPLKLKEAWASETDQSPTFWRPNISAYTR